jgi:mRNA interferase MazF
VRPGYVPAVGDLIWINFHPQAGRERSGRRPALVLSATRYNRDIGLVVCCPITSQKKGYPFEVLMPPPTKVSGGIAGVVLADHVKSMDLRLREAEYAGHADPELIEEVKLLPAALLQMPE